MEKYNPEKYNPKEIPSLNDFDYDGHSQNDTDTIKVYQKPPPSDLANRTSKLSSSRNRSRHQKRPLHQQSSSSSNNSSTRPVKRQRANPVGERPALLALDISNNNNNNGNTSSIVPRKESRTSNKNKTSNRSTNTSTSSNNVVTSSSSTTRKVLPVASSHTSNSSSSKTNKKKKGKGKKSDGDVTSSSNSSSCGNGTTVAVPSAEYLQSLYTAGNNLQNEDQFDEAHKEYYKGYLEASKVPGTKAPACTFVAAICRNFSRAALSRGTKWTPDEINMCRTLLDSAVPKYPESPAECAAAISSIRCYTRQMKSSNSFEEIVEYNSQVVSIAKKIMGKNDGIRDATIQKCLDDVNKIFKKAFTAHEDATAPVPMDVDVPTNAAVKSDEIV